MASFRKKTAFEIGIDIGKWIHETVSERKKNKKILKELDELEKFLEDSYNKMISETYIKHHMTVKARVLAKNREYENGNYKYSVNVRTVEDTEINGVVLVEAGATQELKTKYDYMNCIEGEYVDLHCHLRINKEGQVIKSIAVKGEPRMTTLEDCSKYFLSTP